MVPCSCSSFYTSCIDVQLGNRFDLGQKGEGGSQTPLSPHTMIVSAIFIHACCVKVSVATIPLFCYIQANVQSLGSITIGSLWPSVVCLHALVDLLQDSIHLHPKNPVLDWRLVYDQHQIERFIYNIFISNTTRPKLRDLCDLACNRGTEKSKRKIPKFGWHVFSNVFK